MIVSVVFKFRCRECMAFRRFIMSKLKASHDKRPINLIFTR